MPPLARPTSVTTVIYPWQFCSTLLAALANASLSWAPHGSALPRPRR
jgi:hypothetical protein